MAKKLSVNPLNFPGALRRLALATSLAMPGSVLALSLGDISLDTVLNEPLRAEIDLDAISPQELKDLKVSLGSAEVFKRLGMARPSYLNDLQFEPKLAESGEPVIVISTKQPIKEPFLNFLVEVHWPKGRLLREYTLLLDPPVTGAQSAPKPAPAEVSRPQLPPPPLRPEVAVNNEPVQNIAPPPVTQKLSRPIIKDSPVSPVVDAVEPESPAEPVDSIYTVRENDTLSEIAIRTRPSRTPLDQMMVAIYETNPNAFFKNNINNLKSGVVLRMPDSDSVADVEPKRASNLVVEHVAEWRESLGLSPLKATDVAITESATGEIAQTSTDTDGQAGEVEGSKLDILGTDDIVASADTAETSPQVVAELRLAQELAETRGKENAELAERISQLESVMEKQQKIIEIQSRDLAALQEQLKKQGADLPVAEDADASVTDESDTESVAPAEDSDGDHVRDEEASDHDDDTVIPSDGDAVKPDASTDPDSTEPQNAADTDSASNDAATVPETDSKFGLMVVALVAALGIVAAVGFSRRRGKQEASAEVEQFGLANQPVELAPAVEANYEPVINDNRPELTFVVNKPQAQEEAPKPAPMPSLEDDMQDSQDAVLADADVYLAYGLHQQAEQLLKEALQKEPGRDDYRVKLLEAYANAKDHSKFEYLASELYDRIGSSHPSWPQVAKMGRTINPDNALFSEARVASGSPTRFNNSPSEDARDQRWGKFMGNPTSGGHEGEITSFGAEFKEPVALRENTAYPSKPGQAAPDEASAFSEDAGAKLELAKAYMDMGDEEGARSLIDEILAAGNEMQREQARELSDRIS